MRIILRAEEARDALQDADTVIFDTETRLTQPWRDGKILSCIGVKPVGGESFIMPIRQGWRWIPEDGEFEVLWEPDEVCDAKLTARGKKTCDEVHYNDNAPYEELAKLMDLCRGKTLVPWGAKFDEAVLWQEGVDIVDEDVGDGMVAWRLISEEEPSYKLKWLASKYKVAQRDGKSKTSEQELKQFLKRHGSFRDDTYYYNEAPLHVIAPYLEDDLEYTEWLYTKAMQTIEKRTASDVAEGRGSMTLMDVWELEKQTTRELFHLERHGIKIDVGFVKLHMDMTTAEYEEADAELIAFVKGKLNARSKIERAVLEATTVLTSEGKPDYNNEGEPISAADTLDKAFELWKKQGMRFNPLSSTDVRVIARGMGLQAVYIYGQKTKGDSWDKAHIEKSAEESGDDEMKEFATLLVKVRSKKHLADYYKQMLELRDLDDRIHPSIQQAGTKTGRTSCIEPNMQNIPKRVDKVMYTEEEWEAVEHADADPMDKASRPDKAFLPVRHAFTALDKDHILVSVDWAQIELRILADYANEPKWLTAFELGLDVHSLAALAAGAPPQDKEEREKKWRFKGKQINLAIVYGIGNARLGRTIHPEDDPDDAKKKAGRYKSDYFSRYPAIKKFLKKVEDRLEWRREQLGGMKGWVASKYGRRRYLPVDKFYKGPNFMVQGTSADFMKAVTVGMRQLRELSLAQMVNIVHDEYIFYIHLDRVERAVPIIVLTMENGDRINKCVLKADVSWTPGAWDEVQSLNCETCGGSGRTYPKTPDEMFQMMVDDDWEGLEALKPKGEGCGNCQGRGYDLGPVVQYREGLRGKKSAKRISRH